MVLHILKSKHSQILDYSTIWLHKKSFEERIVIHFVNFKNVSDGGNKKKERYCGVKCILFHICVYKYVVGRKMYFV